ncbi:phosphopantetheine-binding protein [Phytohabitans flavus]|uniref:KS-MAT linker domain-containing protein n=1 Tax=Phytohabitans flavus TaxID=1076124 RepID=UPI0036439764
MLSARTAGQLRVLARDLADRIDPPPAPAAAPPVDAALLDRVRAASAQILGIAPAEIDLDEDFESLGFDGLGRIELAERVRRGGQGPTGLESCANLREMAARLAPYTVESRPGVPTAAPAPSLRDIAYTLAVGREPQRERLGVVAGGAADLAGRLRAFCAGRAADGVHAGQVSAPDSPLDTLFDGTAGSRFWPPCERPATSTSWRGSGSPALTGPPHPRPATARRAGCRCPRTRSPVNGTGCPNPARRMKPMCRCGQRRHLPQPQNSPRSDPPGLARTPWSDPPGPTRKLPPWHRRPRSKPYGPPSTGTVRTEPSSMPWRGCWRYQPRSSGSTSRTPTSVWTLCSPCPLWTGSTRTSAAS